MTDRLSVMDQALNGVVLIARHPRVDERGFLERLYDAEHFVDWMVPARVAQVNRTLTKTAGTIRGMHYQCAPSAETKIVHCIAGEVLDVAVDVRAGSPTFLQHVAHRLSARNGHAMIIPPGFAHGFQSLVDDCQLVYVHSQPYRPDSEGAIHPLDPALSLAWPISVTEMSVRDSSQRPLPSNFKGIQI
jgi:dTDP-4-dehydrorhamnose 3,5-epimerase